ncbi:MAG: hypothetical protein HQ478_16385 [Chloroflexi bacterium]|nr:hypothetical protein [Chloroflexota bacterium]
MDRGWTKTCLTRVSRWLIAPFVVFIAIAACSGSNSPPPPTAIIAGGVPSLIRQLSVMPPEEAAALASDYRGTSIAVSIFTDREHRTAETLDSIIRFIEDAGGEVFYSENVPNFGFVYVPIHRINELATLAGILRIQLPTPISPG